MRVWITRARPDADRTARRLLALGCEPQVAPLIETRPLFFDPPDPSAFAGLAFTSAAGVRAFVGGLDAPARAAWAAAPAWAVGRGTAAAVRRAGLTLAGEGEGGALALADLLEAVPASGSLLIPGAREPAVDLPARLAERGARAHALAVYATAPAEPPPHAAAAALAAGRFDAVLLHSASAARALEALAPPPEGPTWAVALSSACLPRTPGWRTAVAAAPRERDLLRRLLTLDSPPARR